jgi:hypothetical protein
MKNIFLALMPLFIFSKCTSTIDETATKADITQTPTLEKLWESDTLLTGNESIIYDSESDAIYVSCMGQMPDDSLDGDGFIAKLKLDGTIEKLHWVDGLNCPKGMAIYNGQLYVTDIGQLVSIDIITGTVSSKETIENGEFLNDVDIDDDGTIYLTETRKNHILKHQNGITSIYANTEEIGGLNGVHVSSKGILFTGKNGIYLLAEDLQITMLADSMEGTDGIESYRSGHFASSWQGKVFYFENGGNTHKLIDTWADEIYSADIDVIEDKNILLSPTLFNNKVIAYKIK